MNVPSIPGLTTLTPLQLNAVTYTSAHTPLIKKK